MPQHYTYLILSISDEYFHMTPKLKIGTDLLFLGWWRWRDSFHVHLDYCISIGQNGKNALQTKQTNFTNYLNEGGDNLIH